MLAVPYKTAAYRSSALKPNLLSSLLSEQEVGGGLDVSSKRITLEKQVDQFLSLRDVSLHDQHGILLFACLDHLNLEYRAFLKV